MKRVFALLCAAAVLLPALAACGKKTPGPEEPATAPAQPAAYAYEIQTTVDENEGILFQFSRPVFSGSSPLAATANQVYDRMEADYKDKMNAEAPNPTDEPWNYTELSELSYEADGVLSFTTQGDWFMGGVHNSWVTGHTFDFNLGRELKIADFLRGDEEEIRMALVDAFVREVVRSIQMSDMDDAFEQSGADANFYLAHDGVHVFYMPYVVPATQDGVDVLIPWGSYLIKSEFRPAEITTQLVEEITAPVDGTTGEAESTIEPETKKLLQTKEELVAYFNQVSDQVKIDKPGYTWTQQTSVENITSPSSAIEWLAGQAMKFVSLDVLEMDPAAKGADHRDFGVWGQTWGSRLTPQATQKASLTDKGNAWELRVDLKPEKRGSLPKTEPEHDHGKVFKVYTYDQIYGAVEPYAWLGKIEQFAPSYHDSWAVLTIDKETGRLVRAEYMLTMDGYFKAKPAVLPALEATCTISQHEIYKIG